MNETHRKIVEVMDRAYDKPLAEHEFEYQRIGQNGLIVTGRAYIGCSTSALGRRLREMRTAGYVASRRREGKPFMEYRLVKDNEAVKQVLQPQVAGAF